MKQFTIIFMCLILCGCSQAFVRNQKEQFDETSSYFDNTTLEIQTIINQRINQYVQSLSLPQFKLKETDGKNYIHVSKISNDLSLEIETDDLTTKVYRFVVVSNPNSKEPTTQLSAYALFETIIKEATKNHVSHDFEVLWNVFLKDPYGSPIEVIDEGFMYQAYMKDGHMFFVLEKTTKQNQIIYRIEDMNIKESNQSVRPLITTISLSQYNALNIGMSYQEVIDLIGGEGTLIYEPTAPDDDYASKIYTWLGNGPIGSHATLTFENNVLTNKTQNDLK